MKNESLQEKLARLETKLAEARAVSGDGSLLANRIEGDLDRLMNSAWLNCVELIDREKRRNQIPPALVAAIQFALDNPRGMDFLRYLQVGDFDALHREWPECSFDGIQRDWALTAGAAENACDSWLESEGVSGASPEAYWATRGWMKALGFEEADAQAASDAAIRNCPPRRGWKHATTAKLRILRRAMGCCLASEPRLPQGKGAHGSLA